MPTPSMLLPCAAIAAAGSDARASITPYISADAAVQRCSY
jgi:hypothetical protein